jgi:hypothetical protein
MMCLSPPDSVTRKQVLCFFIFRVFVVEHILVHMDPQTLQHSILLFTMGSQTPHAFNLQYIGQSPLVLRSLFTSKTVSMG